MASVCDKPAYQLGRLLVSCLLMFHFTNSAVSGKTCESKSQEAFCRSQNMDKKVYDGIELVEDSFGTILNSETGNAEIVRRFTLTNKNKMSVQIITYGAIVTSIKVPDNKGNIADVVLGFDDLAGYQQKQNPYFGAVIGRVANRIGNDATFKICDQVYNLNKNLNGKVHLHGGIKGFDKALWESHVEGSKLTLSYLSKDGEEGYPGEVLTQANYQLTPNNTLILEITATSTKPTPVNIVNHSYFNLAGHTSGAKEIYNHIVSINANRYTVTDHLQLPTGEIRSVGDTVFDLRIPKRLGDVFPQTENGFGFDNNLCVNQDSLGGTTFVSRVVHPRSGRVLEVYSNQPGVQFYTSNFLPEEGIVDPDLKVIGKEKAVYNKHGAFCLETQNFPDAINHKNFPNSILSPGKTYSHIVSYQFSTTN